MKKRIIHILIIIFILSSLIICIESINNKPKIILDKSSYFDGFYIKDNKVFLKCVLTIKNNSINNANFEILGEFANDRELIVEKSLIAKNDKNEKCFLLKAGQKKTVKVVFVGTLNKTAVKDNRLLPNISFRLIK